MQIILRKKTNGNSLHLFSVLIKTEEECMHLYQNQETKWIGNDTSFHGNLLNEQFISLIEFRKHFSIQNIAKNQRFFKIKNIS